MADIMCRVRRWLGCLKGHRTHIGIWTSVMIVLVRLAVLPDDEFVEVVRGGMLRDLGYMLAAIALVLLFSKAGDAVKEKLAGALEAYFKRK